MSWQDPTSPWAKAMQRRVAMLDKCGFAAIVLATYAVLGAAVGMWGVWVSTSSIGLTLALGARCFARAHGCAVLARKIVESDGAVCTQCRSELEKVDERFTCRRCRRDFARGDVIKHWEQHALQYEDIRHWPLLSAIGAKRPHSLSGVCAAGVFLAAPPVLVNLLIPSHFGATARVAITFIVSGVWLAFCGQLAGMARRRRDDGTRWCANCDTRRPDADTTSVACPKCTRPWTESGETVYGSSIWKWNLRDVRVLAVAAGCALFFAGVAAAIRARQIAEFQTRSVITLLITSAAERTSAMWADARRDLLPGFEDLIVDCLLDEPPASWSADNSEWFRTNAGLGRIGDKRLHAYFENLTEPHFALEPDLENGDQFYLRFSTGGPRPRSWPSGTRMVLQFEKLTLLRSKLLSPDRDVFVGTPAPLDVDALPPILVSREGSDGAYVQIEGRLAVLIQGGASPQTSPLPSGAATSGLASQPGEREAYNRRFALTLSVPH